MKTVSFAAKMGFLFAGLALASCATTRTSPGKPSSVQAALDIQVPALLGKYRIASVGVALIVEGRVVIERGYGEQSPGVSATPATLFNLASLTKPVTAEVLLRLVAANQLSLDEPMSSQWVDPDIASDARHQQLTARLALSHQTGLPNWRGHSSDGRLAFAFAPGGEYGYSGEGYSYAARFAERKLGRSFEELAQEQLFAPLRMPSTAFSWRDWMQGRLAVPLDSDGRWGEPQVESAGQWNGANNLITTAGDYARFVASVMRGEGLTRGLAAERMRPVSGPQPEWQCEVASGAACPRASKVALGWSRLEFADGPVFIHTGSNGRPGGERTLAYFDPRRRRGVVILTSGTEGERLYRDIAAIMDPGSSISAYLAARSVGAHGARHATPVLESAPSPAASALTRPAGVRVGTRARPMGREQLISCARQGDVLRADNSLRSKGWPCRKTVSIA